MKHLFIIFSLMIFSCGGDDHVDPHSEYDYGSITALKNGEQWSAEIHGADNDDDPDDFGIDINKYNTQGFPKEGLSVSFVPKKDSSGNIIRYCYNNVQDTCKLPYQGTYATLSGHGDVVCDRYKIVSVLADENWIEITEFNSDTKEFRGTFRAVFAIDEDRPRCDVNAPDTIRFTNGQFYSKITR